jgi:hypothetical protein
VGSSPWHHEVQALRGFLKSVLLPRKRGTLLTTEVGKEEGVEHDVGVVGDED